MNKAKDILFLLTLEPLVSSGRIGRLKYLLLSIWSWWALVFAILLAQLLPQSWTDIGGELLAAAALFYIFATALCLGIRRLHDMGTSGVLVVLVGIIWPLLLLWPGQPRNNRYGPRLSPATA
ncbi:DUF805 domain-containing protein [Pseudomonas sp. zbq_18]|uniref:DUF805 domain-containing protein n=1 Tax=Pseudomonadota TaxID=1224 RepID=UPI00370BD021